MCICVYIHKFMFIYAFINITNTTCRVFKDGFAAIADGSDYRVNKFSNMTYQSLSWSKKSHFNALRFMHFCALDGLPITVLPQKALYPTGRQNDANIFDQVISHNTDGINDILPPGT